MAYNEGLLNTYSAPAGADLSGKQFYGVALISDGAGGVKVVLGTAAKGIAGVLQNNPLSGQAACYQDEGSTKVAISANTAVTAGALLELDTGGTFKVNATGVIVAQALQSVASTAAITIISARLTNQATV